MRRFAWSLAVGVALVGLTVAGCGKKVSNTDMTMAGSGGAGLDSLATTEELSQIPQASTASQQTGVEILPIETSPVTQAIPPAMPPMMPPTEATFGNVTGETLSYEQKIQTALKNAGVYQGAIDGKIGPKSRKAIEEFQRNNGLTPDGKVGPKTWAVLESFLAGQQASSASNTE